MPPRGFSVRLYFPDGDPRGLKTIQRSGWTGQGVAFPRSAVPSAIRRDELKRPGVYILWNRDIELSGPEVYVGQSDHVLQRLYDHDKGRDFWTDAVAFTSRDDDFNSVHARYLEAALIKRAKSGNQCELINKTEPTLPAISQADADDAASFLEQMLNCLPVVGLTAFEPFDGGQQQADRLEMTIDYRSSKNERVKGISARGYPTVDNFVILQGSLAVKEETKSFQIQFPNDHAYRDLLKSQGILVPDDERPNALRFTKDLVCSSPSRAAGVVRGTASNGREDWKDAQGRSLNDLARLNTGPDDQ